MKVDNSANAFFHVFRLFRHRAADSAALIATDYLFVLQSCSTKTNTDNIPYAHILYDYIISTIKFGSVLKEFRLLPNMPNRDQGNFTGTQNKTREAY